MGEGDREAVEGAAALAGQWAKGGLPHAATTVCSMAPKIECRAVSRISRRTVSPAYRNGVTGAPVRIVSTVRCSPMQL